MMIIKKSVEIEKKQVVMEGVKEVWIQWLIGEKSGAPNFYLRRFEVGAGGHTPFHAHTWEHEVYILEGSGLIRTDRGNFPVEPGCFALIEPEEKHQFENNGSGTLKFLCIIPRDGK
jgi:quercetin dioxygenase-like cupin family protein